MGYKSSYSKDFNLKKPTKNTELLLNEIKEATNIYDFLKKNNQSFKSPEFSDYFNQLLLDKKISKSKLLYDSGLSRSYVYKLLSGTRMPSRDTVILLALTIKASLEESYRLLKYSGYQPLYAKDLRDTIVIYGLNQGLTHVDVDNILYDLNIETIGQ